MEHLRFKAPLVIGRGTLMMAAGFASESMIPRFTEMVISIHLQVVLRLYCSTNGTG